MKKIYAAIFTIAFAVSATFVVSPANAGQLSTGGSSLSWNDANFYYPVSCSSYVFSYANGDNVNFGHITISNKFGDTLGVAMTSGSTGQQSVQICSTHATPADAPFTLTYEVHQNYTNSDGSTSIVTSAFVLQSRSTGGTGSDTGSGSGTNAGSGSSVSLPIYVCVNKKKFSVKRAPASLICSKGWVRKILK